MAEQKQVSDLVASIDDAAQLRSLASVAEEAEQFDDMAQVVKKLVSVASPLSKDDRNLLSVAFKNRVGGDRNAVRTLESEDQVPDNCKPARNAYLAILVKRVENQCKEIIALLKEKLITQAESESADTYVFYTKMAADYYRYAAEATNDDAAKQEFKDGAKEFYGKAWARAEQDDGLPSTSPIRLGLALNYSVCRYEILGEKKDACDMAKKAFDDAIAKLDELNEEEYKDATLIMQLLRDNLTLWTSEENENE